MKKIINLKVVLLAAACLFLFNISAEAQKRKPTKRVKTTAAKSAPKANVNATLSAIAVDRGAQSVSDKIKALSRFLYLLGGSAALIKAVDSDIQQGKLTGNARQQAEIGKKGFIQTITIFKNEISKLENEFRANPALKPYLMQLGGISEWAATAEQQALAGQFEQAGKSLLEVMNQLTDTLQAMP